MKEFGQEVLNEDEFVDFYYRLMRRPEIDELFDKFAAGDEVLEDKSGKFGTKIDQFRIKNG